LSGNESKYNVANENNSLVWKYDIFLSVIWRDDDQPKIIAGRYAVKTRDYPTIVWF
jgi:hypothetical protein